MNTLTEITLLLAKHYNKQIQKFWWNEMINKFLTHKIRHTYSVYSASQRIMIQNRSLSQGISDKLQHRVQIACLLHDIARFYQFSTNTILSNKEFEHWDIWYNILLKEGIEDYWVLFAVKYHNKFDIEWIYKEKLFATMDKEQKEETLYLIKIVRDADKLENIEYMIYNHNKDFSKREWKLLQKEIKDTYITPICLEYIKKREVIDYKNVFTLADQIIAKACWEFDINFEWTKQLIQNTKFKEFIIQKLESISVEEKYLEIVRKYLY